jgi:hypothetical protein
MNPKAATEEETLRIFECLKKNYLNIEAAINVYLESGDCL